MTAFWPTSLGHAVGQPTGGSNSPPTSDLRRCALFNLGFLVGFDPTIDGKRLTFAEVGLLGGVFRMQDHQTGTIWTHLDGKAIASPLVGHRLKMVPIPQATWAGWKSGNTETVMGRRPNPPRPNAVM